MNKANYKDTRITLTEVVLVPFLWLLEHALVCRGILRNNNKLENSKK